jgi:hypothetical protein
MSLKPLNKIEAQQLIDFDAESLKSEIIAKIQMDPDWSELYNPDIESNAFQMILNTHTFIGEKIATHANILIKEKFVNQAFSPQAIFDNLNNMFIPLQQPTASVVDVVGVLQGEILQEPMIIPRFTTLIGYNANNDSVTFEFIQKENGKYKYFDNIIFYPNSTFTDHIETTAYAGQTTSVEYLITNQMKENFIINVDVQNIIEDSIQVYFMGATPIELPQTTSFSVAPDIVPFYFPNGKPHYVVQYKQDGSANLLFGNAEFGGAFEDQHVGSTLIVFCRYGGGKASNIPVGGINQVIKVVASGGRNVSIQFTNAQSSSGGIDKEDIYKAQVFAPYRYGRGRAILDGNDIKNQIYQLIVKHEVDTPQYDEVDRTVPILHAIHRVVYDRNFSSFSVPSYTSGETLAEYKTRFLTSLNSFCNASGIREGNAHTEDVTKFVYPDSSGYTLYNHIPESKYPISGSLKATAYDYRGTAIDSITWKTNYIVDSRNGSLSKSATPSEHTILTSNNFSYLTVNVSTAGRNDLFYVRFDYEKRPYTFQLQLTAGIKTPAMLAAELQSLIQSKIAEDVPEYFADARTWVFVTYAMVDGSSTEGHIILTSPSLGYDSTIEIVDNGTPDAEINPGYNLYLYLGFSKKIYRPASETGLVFGPNNLFNYSQNTINFEFKNTRYSKIDTKTEASLGLVINHSSSTAPLIDYIFYGENIDFIEKLFENYDLSVTAYDSGNNPVDHMIFSAISSTVNNPGVLGDGTEFLPETYTPGSIFKDSSENKFEYSTSRTRIRCIDNVLVPYYTQSYPTIYRVDLVKILEDPLNPGVYSEDPAFTPIQFLESSNNYTHNNATITGKTCILTLTISQNALLISGNHYMVKFYHRTESGSIELKETGKLLNIVLGAANLMTDLPTIQSVVDQAYLHNEYDNTARTIKWKFVDGVLDPAVIYYDKTYADFSYIKSVFKRKTYENIKVQYSPNVYYTEGEVKGIVDIIASKKNRLITLEHIIKSTNFQPMPLIVQLFIRKTYSLNNAIDAVTNLLTDMYGYNNVNSDVTIGTRITQQLIRNTIQSIAATYGILDVTFSSAEILASEHSEDMYHFLIDYSIFEQLREQEFENPDALEGLADSYRFKVTAITEGAR